MLTTCREPVIEVLNRIVVGRRPVRLLTQKYYTWKCSEKRAMRKNPVFGDEAGGRGGGRQGKASG